MVYQLEIEQAFFLPSIAMSSSHHLNYIADRRRIGFAEALCRRLAVAHLSFSLIPGCIQLAQLVGW
jgi:hypothetical protein